MTSAISDILSPTSMVEGRSRAVDDLFRSRESPAAVAAPPLRLRQVGDEFVLALETLFAAFALVGFRVAAREHTLAPAAIVSAGAGDFVGVDKGGSHSSTFW